MKILIIACLSVMFIGCDNKIHNYELDRIAKPCSKKGLDKSVWLDISISTSVRQRRNGC